MKECIPLVAVNLATLGTSQRVLNTVASFKSDFVPSGLDTGVAALQGSCHSKQQYSSHCKCRLCCQPKVHSDMVLLR